MPTDPVLKTLLIIVGGVGGLVGIIMVLSATLPSMSHGKTAADPYYTFALSQEIGNCKIYKTLRGTTCFFAYCTPIHGNDGEPATTAMACK